MNNTNWQAILWDFDGVLMNSNKVRDMGFNEVLKDFPKQQVEDLLKFHQENGGLSRYVKFRFFFEKIRKEQISEEEVKRWAQKFSEIMLKNLVNTELLILETLNFVKNNPKTPMHIVSGSDQEELRQLCEKLSIARFFRSIEGSPTPKKQLVGDLLERNEYVPENCILIGDSVNDFEAAHENGMAFMAYNNEKLISLSTTQLDFTISR